MDENLEEEDIDYEELNALSSFYAENDEDKLISTKPNSETTLESSKGSNGGKQLRCQLCSAALRRYESLRRHYITIHGYNSASALPEVSCKPRVFFFALSDLIRCALLG